MAQAVTGGVRRRLLFGGASVAVVVSCAVLYRTQELALRDASRTSGWTTLGIVVALALYGVRRKLPYPPLLNASLWLRVHAWLGLVGIAVYVLHAGAGVPHGRLEQILAVLFAAVAGSGVVGLALSRVGAQRLTARGQEVVFERVPVLRLQLAKEAAEVVQSFRSGEEAGPLIGYYERRLVDFFAGPRHRLAHLRQSRRPLLRLRHELGALDRYLDDAERHAAAELGTLIEAKDALDYHVAVQGVLKAWLFVHVPLTAGLLVFTAAHVWVARAFPSGGP